jgi:hypothetical protein
MDAIQQRQDRLARVRGLLALAVVAAVIIAGLVGYWVRGASVTTTSAVAAQAPAQSIAGTSRGLNADSASGYGAGSGSPTFSAVRGLNADSASGYARN